MDDIGHTLRHGDGSPPDELSIQHLDLNLLIALDALLREQSVTKAAERLHRSQPALSASLKRLRRQFDDELLVRVGNHHELTPLAVQLRSRLSVVLADVERLFHSRSSFEPQRSNREFVLGGSDYGEHMLGRAIAHELAAEAPDVRLRFRQLSDELIARSTESIRSLDGMIFPFGFLDELPHIPAFVDRWILIVDRANSLVGDAVTLDDLSGLDFVSAFHRDVSMVPAVRQLQLMGVDVTVSVATEGFTSIPFLVQGTDRIAVIQEGLAHQIINPAHFRLLECPFDAVPLVESFWWHPSLDHDPGHMWFRGIVERAGQRLAQELGPVPPEDLHQLDR